MKCVKFLTVGLLIVMLFSPVAHAQSLFDGILVDSAFRVEYLLGRQSVGKYDQNILYWDSNGGNPNPIETLNLDFICNQLVLDGLVEVTPFPAISSRFRGNVSVAGGDRNMTLGGGPTLSEFSAVVKPSFWSWEAAGQYNLSYGGGYRFALVGGYRYESQSYHSSNDSGQNWHLWADFTSQIPFVGLQTVMVTPSWKARFELLGSSFMTKKVSQSARDNIAFMKLNGSMNNGGFLEFQVEGSVPVTPNWWLGLYTQGTYEGLKGELIGTSVDANASGWYVPTPYNFYTSKFFWFLGLNCSVFF